MRSPSKMEEFHKTRIPPEDPTDGAQVKLSNLFG
jgi:hypothetical protein